MIDLHTHSTFSDGSFTPEQLAGAASHIGLTAIALTDHDSIGGIDRFLAACRKQEVRGIPGVEISLDFPDGTMHLLGYFIDHHNEALTRHIAKLVAGRKHRNQEILKQVNAMGMPLTLNEVAAYAGEDNVGRLHFAQALVARGYVRTRDEAFKKYLAKGKPGYADRSRMTPAEGVAIISNAGGLAVLAHPFTLHLGKQALAKLVGELARAGLQGIEVFYPQQGPKLMKEYCALARQFNLVATGGTDFHGAPMPDIQLGSGFGNLNVPESILEELDARRAP
ncbi:MAG: PHP domain-containing protein [Verrucomicrobia bacterium]|nr:PHP domain-containing protein [Verrucomicrobiota bacterium]MCG2681385.1 PHP domain-containing protein [Kiritimatiellia bacterium]MBU4248160.1 PHP domain-containing protein [Verrucomicrobiota bacterium]MBU4291801.1 PHP domain-containing protein [Verrucomicrobiota bacterium]MBU4427815.1 PHP domain-containing protein [Verrucomicrobiota bacterium]